MSTLAWVLLIFLKAGFGGGATTVGYFTTEVSCQQAAKRVLEAFPSIYINSSHVLCLAVDYAEQER